MTPGVDRRRLLGAAGAMAFGAFAAAALRSCGEPSPSYIHATDPEIAQTEQKRRRSGRTVRHRLVAEEGMLSLEPGKYVSTWGVREDAALAALGPTLRASRGDRLVVDVDNRLPEATSMHWHGLRIRNDMDGAPPDTQAPISTGERFAYDFVLPDHGTYWYHSHSGLQADRSMFGALIVEDPDDTSGADLDLVLVIDDWLLESASPEEVLSALGADHQGGHDHGSPGSAPPAASEEAIRLVSQGRGTRRCSADRPSTSPIRCISSTAARRQTPQGWRCHRDPASGSG